ncbi:MAG: alanine--glyoxylate aminotransferase family protein [Clostridiaceae bacterium]|nr:alanine--glyoxylate aminotransferase family protein [Clostridiaceae bacterium]
MHKRLFIPGPVEVLPEVLARMATPMIGHRTREASALQESISGKMKQLMYTQSEIILSTSSGSGLMEGAIRSCTRRRAAVFSIGAFGDRWYKMAVSNGVPADLFQVELGSATDPEQVEKALATGLYDLVTITHNETATGVANPLDSLSEVIRRYPDVIWCVDAVSSLGGHKIETDRLGIDILISSSQKCLGLPPGLAVCSVSEKAIKAAEQVPHRGMYFDYVELYRFVREKNYQYPSTPSLSHMFALDYQLDRILKEGLDQRFQRCQDLAARVQDWARTYFALFADERYLSHTVTCIRNTRQLNFAELNRSLGSCGYQISNGYGAVKDLTFRIAHMADTTMEDLNALLDCLNELLHLA